MTTTQAAVDVSTQTWRNRIVGHADVSPAELVPNPRNWRSHPPEQQKALAGALAEIGWVAEVMVNRARGAGRPVRGCPHRLGRARRAGRADALDLGPGV